MKRIFSILMSFIFILSLPIAVFAEDKDENMIIREDEVVNSDLFFEGDSVKNMGTVKGDIFVASGEFENTGHVLGDILLVAGNSKISGRVDGDLRIGTGNLNITGEIGKNVTSFSGNLILEEGAAIDGNLNAFLGNIVINGIIGGDFRGSADDIKINGKIKGDVILETENLIFGPNAKIDGNLVYNAPKKIEIKNGIVSGNIIYKPYGKKIGIEEKNIKKGFNLLNILRKGIPILSYLIIGTILVLVFSNFMKKTSTMIDKKPWHSLGIGIVGFIVIPIASILIMITVVGIPIGVISLILYGLLLYLAKIPAALLIGQKLLRNESKLLIKMIIGLIILSFVSFIPYLGKFISFMAIIFGIGSYLLNLKEAIKKPKNIEPLH
ncbi:polymer-forming cytoskeletal protein [Crassaminicella thermophila]|uniref:Polymer-forming cytoskeletal protein n=1 Tax=Crassaminicella thermophila TaxID=2599308 RepID=A0A5C0SHB2_CRATE|nr:polymer-forming cytoskeletal protein [Crassaminicella thermophila]QEK13116.1 polymer-forming cytoskeletal protein [Crassaminicella thermophila]